MDCEGKTGSLSYGGCQFSNSGGRSDGLSVVVNDKDVEVQIASIPDGPYARQPVTPDREGESRDKSRRTIKSEKEIAPHTPKDDALGDRIICSRENVDLGYQKQRHFDEWRGDVTRRLNFGFSIEIMEANNQARDLTSLSDEEMFNSLCESFLEIILLGKSEDLLAEISTSERVCGDCATPPSSARLVDVAETCPGAPMKRATLSRNVSLGLCRKLQF